ncbi:MAG: hypothetical protein J6P20_07075 [Oscillospiraceae bacterium]|nr:hypothetical protein [Oscillospiraceae bacterium]
MPKHKPDAIIIIITAAADQSTVLIRGCCFICTDSANFAYHRAIRTYGKFTVQEE